MKKRKGRKLTPKERENFKEISEKRNKNLIHISLDKIHQPEDASICRRLSNPQVERISNPYYHNYRAVEVNKLLPNYYEVLDGQHRCEAARNHEEKTVLCVCYNGLSESAAAAATKIGNNSVAQQAIMNHLQGVASGDAGSIGLQKALNEAGVSFTGDKSKYPAIGSVQTIMYQWEIDSLVTSQVLNILAFHADELCWARYQIIKGFFEFIREGRSDMSFNTGRLTMAYSKITPLDLFESSLKASDVRRGDSTQHKDVKDHLKTIYNGEVRLPTDLTTTDS